MLDDNQNIDLSRFSTLDTMVTVVDCFNFFNDYVSTKKLADRLLTDDPANQRNMVSLLTDQIDFANLVVLNKTYLIKLQDLGLLKAIIQKMNLEAKLVESQFGKVQLSHVLNTGLFDLIRHHRLD